MKKKLQVLLAFGAGVIMMSLLSLTYSGAASKTQKLGDHRLVYMIPIKPKATRIVHNQDVVYKLIDKGYQIHFVTAGENFVMVKY